MSYLSTITTGGHSEGMRIVIAAQEKMGKTTLASGAPEGLLVPLEIGYAGVKIPHTAMIQDFPSVMQMVDEIIYWCQQGQFPYRSLIFDSGTALERQIHNEVVGADGSKDKNNTKAVTMESALGGYGRAYTYANEKFDNFLKKCDILAVTYGINIIITCHVFAAKLIDPASGEYDSWDLQLHSPKNQKTYGKRELITQWADVVGFLYEPMYITKGEGMNKGVSAQKGRMLGMNRTPSYVAGNRFGVQGEISIPLDKGWNYFADAIYKACGIDIFNRSL